MLLLLLLVCLVLDVLLQIRARIMWHAQRVEGNGSQQPRYSNKSAGFHRPIRLDERTTELRAKYYY